MVALRMTGSCLWRQPLGKLRQTAGGSDEDLAELIDSLLEEAPCLMNSLLAASVRGDLATIR
jgi:hypothetical protein